MATMEKAITIAADAHRAQFDKGGAPYILHPLRLMLQMDTLSEMIVAVLHDVVEDSGWTFESLRQEGFSEEVLDAIDHLTRRKTQGETYEAFIERAGKNPIARKIKSADLEDNMDIKRLKSIGEKDVARLRRYKAAWEKLQ